MYTEARVEEKKCTGCKLCIICCPDPNVLMLDENKKISVNEGRCKGCGLCAVSCPQKAITVRDI